MKGNTFADGKFDAERDWEGRHTAGYVVYKGKMWIIGGDANQGHYQNDVWNSTDGGTWRQVNRGRPVPWGPRALHHTLVFKGNIWVMVERELAMQKRRQQLIRRKNRLRKLYE